MSRSGRRTVLAAGAGGVMALATGLAACLGTAGEGRPQAVDRTPPPAASTPGPGPSDATTAPSTGQERGEAPVLALEALPPVGDEGVAVETAGGVVLVGLDGTVHGRLPAVTLATGPFSVDVPGLIQVNDQQGGGVWIDARNGATLDRDLGTPVGYDGLLVHEGDAPGRIVLDAGDGAQDFYGIAANPDTYWWLSANHDVVSWTVCDGAAHVSACEGVAVADLDIGGTGQLPNGCWHSDKLGDFFAVTTCWRPWGESGASRSWLELPAAAGGSEPVRVEVPLPEGAPGEAGHFVKALVGGPGVVAELSLECELPRVVGVADGEVVGLLGPAWDDGPAATLLGVGATSGPWAGAAVVRVRAQECGEDTGVSPGVYLVGADHDLTPVMTGPDITAAQMWTLAPSIPAIRERLERR